MKVSGGASRVLVKRQKHEKWVRNGEREERQWWKRQRSQRKRK